MCYRQYMIPFCFYGFWVTEFKQVINFLFIVHYMMSRCHDVIIYNDVTKPDLVLTSACRCAEMCRQNTHLRTSRRRPPPRTYIRSPWGRGSEWWRSVLDWCPVHMICWRMCRRRRHQCKCHRADLRWCWEEIARVRHRWHRSWNRAVVGLEINQK